MHFDDVIRGLRTDSGPRIVLLVLDGVGDVPSERYGYTTPLEAASTPNIDAIAPKSSLGRLTPVAPGITPGSGPGHLGLFGYDPLEVDVARGVLEALGIDLDLSPGVIAARANFATMTDGLVADRRAGRISDDDNKRLVAKLTDIGSIDGVAVQVHPGKGHRFVVLFEGDDIAGPLTDSDPGREDARPLAVAPVHESPAASRAAAAANAFIERANQLLEGEKQANGVLLRGIDSRPDIPLFPERYGLTAAAIAAYPMYRGLAQLVGMTKVPTPDGPEAEFETYRSVMKDYDFAFIHIKATDMHGEDGNFEGKTAAIEAVDRALPILLDTKPGVLAITGDHSTPVAYRAHGWQPVPVLIHAERAGGDGLPRFTERLAVNGLVGSVRARYLMAIMLAAAGRLQKFGA